MDVCFLGYGRDQTTLIKAIESGGFNVTHKTCKVDNLSRYDAVISFGYRHILSSDTLKTLKRPALNLHIAYLPYNRGAHPNFWSWIDGTPSGVTIHEIDKGIDTGPICFQKAVAFDKTENTFARTYSRLIAEIEELFIANMACLLDGTYKATPQSGPGTYHNSRDLPEWAGDWDALISDQIKRAANASDL